MTPYPTPDSPWQEDARYHPGGLPANMSAILHDQFKRRRLAR